jgi:outer membrane protein
MKSKNILRETALKIKNNRYNSSLGVLPILSLIVFISISLLLPITSIAQKIWTINMCLDYAIENNIDLNVAYNGVDRQEINLFESKIQMLPDLNLGSGVNINFGRNIDGNTNNVTYDRTVANSYWASTSVDVFQGLVQQNTIKYNKYLLSASQEQAKYVKNTLILNVLTSYYTVLYSKGLTDVAISQVALSEMQYKRMQKLVDVGRESPITVQELESQWAEDKLSLTLAQNNYNKTILELKHLLRLDTKEFFTIDTTTSDNYSLLLRPEVDSLFDVATQILPEIKEQQYLYKASEKDLAVAKGNLMPRIYMSAGFNTGYFDGDTMSFNSQIENNQNQIVNLGIVIPIFNRGSVYSKIKRKRLAVENQQLSLQKQKDNLYTQIWNAVDDVQASENEFKSARELYEFSELTLKNVTSKMEKGLASTTDYEASKQRFIFAKASLLRARLIYVMRQQMLEFYRTGTWDHLMQ